MKLMLGLDMIVVASVVMMCLTLVLTQLFCTYAQNTKLMDKPNNRSMHSKPTVRGGGLIFIGLPLLALPFICYFTDIPIATVAALLISALLIGSISFLDDLYTLSAKSRFMVQALAACIIAFFLMPAELNFVLFAISNPPIMFLFLFFCVLWAINHFNFMDGLDGLCASQALFLFVAYAWLFNDQHAFMYRDFCFILISCLSGFLIFNFPPAKLFMGDVGSATLGLIGFCLAVIGQQLYQIPIAFWFLLNGLFLFDTTLTLLRRVIKGEQWFMAHRKHAYQRLKQAGMTARMILLGQLVLNVVFLMLVLLVDHHVFHMGWVFVFQIILMVFVYLMIEKQVPMYLPGI